MERAAECPRCGYDLSGLVATWTLVCPLGARCSECGLEFDCGNALSSRAIGPKWSFEHARRGLAGAWWRTSSNAAQIWPLAIGLRIDHAVRRKRLIAFAASWLLVGWLFASLLAFLVNPSRVWWGGGPGGNGSFPESAWPYGVIWVPAGVWGGQAENPMMTALLAMYLPAAVMPLGMLALGTTLSRARVRRAHLLRGFAYSVPVAVAAAHGLMALSTGAIVATLRGWYLPAVLEGVVFFGMVAASAAWLLLWWWTFIKRNLRLTHAFTTALLMWVQAVLVLVISLLLMSIYRAL